VSSGVRPISLQEEEEEEEYYLIFFRETEVVIQH
jgi:hypothetical protein